VRNLNVAASANDEQVRGLHSIEFIRSFRNKTRGPGALHSKWYVQMEKKQKSMVGIYVLPKRRGKGAGGAILLRHAGSRGLLRK